MDLPVIICDELCPNGEFIVLDNNYQQNLEDNCMEQGKKKITLIC